MKNYNTNESEEMYLETILLLQRRNGQVHPVDIATELGYAKPSITRAIKCLAAKEYITYGAKNEVTLTEKGLAKANEIYDRHKIIMQLLVKLGADEALAEENACRIEHVITDEMMELIKKHLD